MFLLPSEYNYSVEQIYIQKWNSKKYSYLKIPRPSFGILFVLKGNIDYIADGCTINLSANDLIFLPKGSNYDVVFHTENGCVEDLLINFSIDLPLDKEFSKSPTYILNDSSNLLKSSFMQLYDAFANDKSIFLIKSLFYQCLHGTYLLNLKKHDKDFTNIQTAKKLLSDEYDYSVEDIAEKLFMSRSCFQKKFKQMVGTTPSQYRVMAKIEKAKRLLVTTDIPIKDIALSLGYYDISYFYKQFYKNCNTTPQKYRAMSNEKMQL